MCMSTDCKVQKTRNEARNTSRGMLSICAIDVRKLCPLVHSTPCGIPISELVSQSCSGNTNLRICGLLLTCRVKNGKSESEDGNTTNDCSTATSKGENMLRWCQSMRFVTRYSSERASGRVCKQLGVLDQWSQCRGARVSAITVRASSSHPERLSDSPCERRHRL